MKKWQCIVCGWIYDEAEGYEDEGIAPGTPWRTGRYAFIFVAFGFVVNPAADNALPFFHISSAQFLGSQKRRTL